MADKSRKKAKPTADLQLDPVVRLEGVRKRMLVVASLFMILFCVGGYRSYELQIRDRDDMLKEAERNYLRTMVVEARRGDIRDRNGEQLATSVRVDTIVANPREVRNPVETARNLSAVLSGVDEKALARKLKSKSWWEYVKRRVTEEESSRVRALKLDGVLITQEWKRFYPKGEMLGQVLGRAGLDATGLEGLEKALDAHLYPKAGANGESGEKKVVKVPYIKDIRGKKAYVEGLPGDLSPEGSTLELTIDANIQDVTEKALARGVTEHKGISGIAVVMDVRNGELLAMANYPFFDPNDPMKTDMYDWKNRLVKDQFEPGSTMKVFSLAAVLEAGKANLDEVIDVEGGRMRIGRHWIRDSHKADELTVREVIGHSSNVGIAKLTERIEKSQLFATLQAFGFGKKTGVETDYEAPGKIQPLKNWGDITYANISFGQGIAVSALQLVQAFAALGNAGEVMRPRLVRRVMSEDGRTLVPVEPEVVGRAVSSDVAKAVIAAMETCVSPDGTAPAAAIRGYRVAGKTGTAQKPMTGYRRGKKIDEPTGGYYDDKWLSSFIGLVPADRPRLAILVLVDEPEGRGFGGVVAAPIFREIGEWSLRYLGVPSSHLRPLKVSSLSRTAKKVPAARVQPPVVPVEVQTAQDGMGPYVPDVLGKPMSQVVRLARSAGLQVEIRGSGRAVTQSPLPGMTLPEGGVLSVEFRSPGETNLLQDARGGNYAP